MYEALPKRLATLRRSKAMSQEELANMLGVSRQAVSKWERGESSPDTLNLIGLADLYEMSLDELVRGAATQNQTFQSLSSETFTPLHAATKDCKPQDKGDFSASEVVIENTTSTAAATTKSATDGVVKVEVVTTTIPLDAATSFLPSVESKTQPQAPVSSTSQTDEPSSNTKAFTDDEPASQLTSPAPRPQTPMPEYVGAPKDPHAYPPPTDTAYELPITPPPAPFPQAQTPYAPPTPSARGHFQPGSQGPVAHQRKHKQHEPKGALMSFPYPMLCVILYLAFGFLFQAWHPGWIIFFTVPIYYWIAEIIEKDPIYQLRKQQREALIRNQINFIEQSSANQTSDPTNEYPPTC